MTKTVLQVVQHLKPGGIETMALDLQQHLDNCQVHIVSLEGTKKQALKDWPRLIPRKDQLHFLNKKSGISFMSIAKLALLIKKLNVEAVHTHHIGPLTYGGMAARLAGVKHLIHTEHDAWHLEDPKAAALERKLIHHLSPTLVADCTLVASKLSQLDDTLSPHIIYNGIDTDRFRPAQDGEKQQARAHFNLPKDVHVIGCAARLEDVKGLPYLIDALSALPDDVCLALAGEGSCMDRLKLQAASNNTQERVFFLGRVEEMDLFYKAIDLFCLPSLNEGFPLSPLEAQACNVPAIVTDVGGAKETLCPHTGTLVDAKDAPALSRALKKKLYEPRTHAPRQFVLNQANIGLMTAAYAKLLAI